METYPIHHIGIAVTDLEAGIELYTRAFGYKVTLREEIAPSKISLAFLATPNTLIELLAPTSEESTISKFLKTRGPGLHHLCYQVNDIEKALREFISQGYEAIDKVPRAGADKSRIAFLHPRGFEGVLVELWGR